MHPTGSGPQEGSQQRNWERKSPRPSSLPPSGFLNPAGTRGQEGSSLCRPGSQAPQRRAETGCGGVGKMSNMGIRRAPASKGWSQGSPFSLTDLQRGPEQPHFIGVGSQTLRAKSPKRPHTAGKWCSQDFNSFLPEPEVPWQPEQTVADTYSVRRLFPTADDLPPLPVSSPLCIPLGSALHSPCWTVWKTNIPGRGVTSITEHFQGRSFSDSLFVLGEAWDWPGNLWGVETLKGRHRMRPMSMPHSYRGF